MLPLIYYLCKDKRKGWYSYYMLLCGWLGNPKMFGDFKQEMIREFEVTNIGHDLLPRNWDQTSRKWNLYESKKVCKRDSQKVQDRGLCKSEFSSWVWSKDVKEWWRREDKLYNIQESSWEFEITCTRLHILFRIWLVSRLDTNYDTSQSFEANSLINQMYHRF